MHHAADLLRCLTRILPAHRCSIGTPLCFSTWSASSHTDKHDIVAIIAKHFQYMPDEPTGRTIALSSWVSDLHLARTGPAVIEVDGGPDDYDNGATGNGDIWLFRRVGNHAVLIFSGGGFTIKPESKTYHNGMLDIHTDWNMSCCNGGIEVYRFDGHRYKPAYRYDYETDEDGKMKFGPHGKCENNN